MLIVDNFLVCHGRTPFTHSDHGLWQPYSPPDFSARRAALRAGDVLVWRCVLGAAPAWVHTVPLSEEEWQRTQRLHFACDRQHYLFAHRLLRGLLEGCSGVPATDLQLAVTGDGKPWLSQMPDLQFNMSHAGDAVLIGLAWQRAIGVDLETQANLPSDRTGLYELARYCLSAQEWRLFAGRCDAHTFLTLWTRKEALLKAEGGGLTHMRETSLATAPADAGDWLTVEFRAQRWRVLDMVLDGRLQAAVAIAGEAGARVRSYCLGWYRPTLAAAAESQA